MAISLEDLGHDYSYLKSGKEDKGSSRCQQSLHQWRNRENKYSQKPGTKSTTDRVCTTIEPICYGGGLREIGIVVKDLDI